MPEMQLEIYKMKREDFDTDEEYVEFRRLANLRNKKYYSKLEVKLRKKKYKLEYSKLPHVKEAEKKMRETEHYKKRMKMWREQNEEKIIEYRNKPKNKINKKISDKKYYKRRRKNKSLVQKDRARLGKYRKEHPEKKKKAYKKYLNSEKGKMNYRFHNQRRLALLRKQSFEINNKDIEKIYERDSVCVYCESNNRLEIDHVIALSCGGDTTVDNLVISCKKCNCSKGNKEVTEWCQTKNIKLPKIVQTLLNN